MKTTKKNTNAKCKQVKKTLKGSESNKKSPQTELKTTISENSKQTKSKNKNNLKKTTKVLPYATIKMSTP